MNASRGVGTGRTPAVPPRPLPLAKQYSIDLSHHARVARDRFSHARARDHMSAGVRRSCATSSSAVMLLCTTCLLTDSDLTSATLSGTL